MQSLKNINFCNIFHVYNNFTEKWPGNSESAPLITPITIKTQKWKFWRFFFQNFCKTWNHQELPTHTILFQHQHFHSPRKWNIHTLSSTHCVAEVFPENFFILILFSSCWLFMSLFGVNSLWMTTMRWELISPPSWSFYSMFCFKK